MKINYRQTSILVFMSFIALKFLALPSFMYATCGNMGWFAVLVLMTIDALYAWLILMMAKRSGTKNVNEFMTATLGKVLTKVCLLALMIKYALIVVNIAKGLEFFIVENLYEEFKWVLYIIPMILVVGFIIYKGIRNVARLSELFVWAILVACLYIAIKSFKGVKILELFPLFDSGFQPIVYACYKHMSWFGSSTFLIMLFGSIDFKDEKKWTMIKYQLCAILLSQILYWVFYGLFGITSPSHNFGISDISQNYNTNSAISELSWLVVSIWVVAQAIQMAMYGYSFVQSVKFLFDINSNIIPILVFDIGLILWGYLGKITLNLEYIFFSNIASIVTIFASYVVPLIMWCGYMMNKKKFKKAVQVKYEKD